MSQWNSKHFSNCLIFYNLKTWKWKDKKICLPHFFPHFCFCTWFLYPLIVTPFHDGFYHFMGRCGMDYGPLNVFLLCPFLAFIILMFSNFICFFVVIFLECLSQPTFMSSDFVFVVCLLIYVSRKSSFWFLVVNSTSKKLDNVKFIFLYSVIL